MILSGQIIILHTNHNNLVQDALCLGSDYVMKWRILLEEYQLELVHIAVITNTAAYVMSILYGDSDCTTYTN